MQPLMLLMWNIRLFLRQYYYQSPQLFVPINFIFENLSRFYLQTYRQQLATDFFRDALSHLQELKHVDFEFASNGYKLTRHGELFLEDPPQDIEKKLVEVQQYSNLIAEVGNQIARESNEIAKESKEIARRSLWIAVISMLISLAVAIKSCTG